MFEVSAQCVFSSISNYDSKIGCMLAAVLRVMCAFMMCAPGWFMGQDSYKSLIDQQNLFIQGCILSAITAAAVSSLAGIFNATTTVFVYDIYKTLRPNVLEDVLIFRARMFNIFLGN